MSLVPGVDDAFWPLFVKDVTGAGRDPIEVAKVMFAESSLTPTAINPSLYTPFGVRKNPAPTVVAVGLNQLTEASGTFHPWSQDAALAFALLPASAQWQSKSGPFLLSQFANHPDAKTARDIYWLNFIPSTFVAGAPDDYLVPNSKEYAEWNPAFKDPRTGLVKVGLMGTFLASRIACENQSLEARRRRHRRTNERGGRRRGRGVREEHPLPERRMALAHASSSGAAFCERTKRRTPHRRRLHRAFLGRPHLPFRHPGARDMAEVKDETWTSQQKAMAALTGANLLVVLCMLVLTVRGIRR